MCPQTQRQQRQVAEKFKWQPLELSDQKIYINPWQAARFRDRVTVTE